MIPEIGNFALILALLLATVQGTLPIIGATRGIPAWIALARPVVQGQFVFVLIAFSCLAYSFVSSDFSVLNVAKNSNTELPFQYRLAATWGSHEGSLLLWVLMLAGWSVAVSVFSKQLPDDIVARVLGVLGVVSIGFYLFMLITSNPFDRLLPAAAEGSDLNPLLQDAGMVVHPPMLYMGYVGFSIAFAFAIAALMSGKLDATWARWSRPWTIVAWVFLTFGIMLGSWWGYYELGWGGWWFWDPVENASFMPWLVGTALVHSLAVTEKRGSFKSWTVLLAICAFALSLLGTFLVRSGVLTSVHAFATDPARGIFILIFLVVVISCSLVLFAWRAPKVGLGGKFDLVSRESMLLTNNILLLVAAASVLLGTLYPLIIDALGLGKLSVGPPYFLDGRKTPVRVHALMHDPSRYLVALRVAPDEREKTMLSLFTQSLMEHGKFDALYLDNGATYGGDILRLACARLGITLLHATPYDAPARGKMERFWRRMREQALDHIGHVASLADVEAKLRTWLVRYYQSTPHAGILGRAPATVFAEGEKVRISEDELRQALTMRVRRRVRRDTIVSVDGVLYEVPLGYLAGQIVTIAKSHCDDSVPVIELDD